MSLVVLLEMGNVHWSVAFGKLALEYCIYFNIDDLVSLVMLLEMGNKRTLEYSIYSNIEDYVSSGTTGNGKFTLGCVICSNIGD